MQIADFNYIVVDYSNAAYARTCKIETYQGPEPTAANNGYRRCRERFLPRKIHFG
jgi:hypothetical protein